MEAYKTIRPASPKRTLRCERRLRKLRNVFPRRLQKRPLLQLGRLHQHAALLNQSCGLLLHQCYQSPLQTASMSVVLEQCNMIIWVQLRL